MQRVATIHVYEMMDQVVLSCTVLTTDDAEREPRTTSTAAVQVAGTGTNHAFAWMREALLELTKTF